MNIVFLNPVGTLGGGERSLLDLLAVLGKARPQWGRHLIVGADGSLVEESARLGVAVQVAPLPAALARLGDAGLGLAARGKLGKLAGMASKAVLAALGVPRYVRRLARLLAAAEPSLIHSNGIKFHLLAGHAAPAGVPVVWHVRDFLGSRAVIGKWLRRLARKPNLAIANSEAVRGDAGSALPGVRVECMYNGIDTDFFSPGAGDGPLLDRLAGLAVNEQAIRVGLVATYARWKGHEVLLEAAARLTPHAPDLRFLLVGGPTYSTADSQYSEEELRGFIHRLRLESRVGLIPFQRDLRPVYRGLDIVVHASTRAEPFGRTVVEAMACGRAVIAARSGGTVEIIQNEVDAVGVEPGDSSALADAITRLAGDPNRRADLGRQARRTAVERFSYAPMTSRLLSLYDSVLDGSAAPITRSDRSRA